MGRVAGGMAASNRVFYACDVGTVDASNSRFGWARLAAEAQKVAASSDIHALVSALVDDGSAGRPVALGFEAPGFLPIREDPARLAKAREGEGNRAFSAQAGRVVTGLGLQQAAWVLRAIRDAFSRHQAITDWPRWRRSEGAPILLLWEAFVSGPAKAPTHVGDAVTAAMAFVECEETLEDANAVRAEAPLNLLAVAALWAGLTIDTEELRRPALVLRPVVAARWAPGVS